MQPNIEVVDLSDDEGWPSSTHVSSLSTSSCDRQAASSQEAFQAFDACPLQGDWKLGALLHDVLRRTPSRQEIQGVKEELSKLLSKLSELETYRFFPSLASPFRPLCPEAKQRCSSCKVCGQNELPGRTIY